MEERSTLADLDPKLEAVASVVVVHKAALAARPVVAPEPEGREPWVAVPTTWPSNKCLAEAAEVQAHSAVPTANRRPTPLAAASAEDPRAVPTVNRRRSPSAVLEELAAVRVPTAKRHRLPGREAAKFNPTLQRTTSTSLPGLGSSSKN